jgi:histidine triad (HIT) family protein
MFMVENKDCIFCNIVSGEVESKKVYEDENFLGFLDINPMVKSHTLIIPKKHFKTILDIPISLGNEMVEAVKKVALDLIEKKKGEGFNVLVNNFEVSGQVVPHLHVHIIPRSEGDGLKIVR